jgi:hypothetical protein
MSLIWHLAWKDLRRLALPIAVWIGFLAAFTLGFASVRPPGALLPTSNSIMWVSRISGSFMIADLLTSFLAAVLAARWAQEDATRGTTAFWRTRPISGPRLFAGKIMAIAVGLILLPTVALALVWAGEGFSGREITAAAAEFMVEQLRVVIPAFALGTATPNLGRFLLFAVLALTVYVMSVVILPEWLSQTGLFLQRSRAFAVVVVGLAGALVLMGWSYFSRRGTSWIFGAILAAMTMTGVGWSADLSGSIHWLASDEEWRNWPAATPDQQKQITATWSALRIRGQDAALVVKVDSREAGHEFVAPTDAIVRVPNPGNRGSVALYSRRGSYWGEAAALQVAGLRPASASLAWEIDLTNFAESVASLRQIAQVAPRSELRMTHMHAQVLWEIPLRAGQEGRAGSSFTRIVNLTPVDGRLTARLHEVDSVRTVDDGMASGALYFWRRSQNRRVDCFLVVNRARGIAQAAGLRDQGAARLNSLMMSDSSLLLPADDIMGDATAPNSGLTLIKVRFEREEDYEYIVPGGPIQIVEDSRS